MTPTSSQPSIVLTNAKTDDVLSVGTLPAGISSSIDTSVPGQITVTVTGTATKAEYAEIIKGITFENTSDDPDLTDRIVEVTVNDGDANSNTAQTTIHIVPVNDPPTIDLDDDNSEGTSGSDYADTFTEGGPCSEHLRYIRYRCCRS